MTLPRRAFLASPCLALAGCATSAPVNVETDKARAVRAIVEGEAQRQRLAGAQYIVLQRGAVMAEGAFGVANLDTETPINADSLFLIASITKMMTYVAALRLADRGVFDLTAPVQHFVPDFPTHPGGQATPSLLLTHDAGIRHYNRERGEPTREMLGSHYETANAALAVFREDAYASAPGTESRYTSYGYALLAACMEAAAGKTFTQILQDEIFAPAGMTNVQVPDMRYPLIGLTHSYSWYRLITSEDSDKLLRARENDFSYNPGGGNVIANARSLAAYGQAWLTPTLLTGTRWNEFVSAPGTPDGEVSALGGKRFTWPVSLDDANRRILHGSGASEAYQGGLSIYPDDELIICALSNTWGIGSRSGGFTLALHKLIGAAVLA